jgi:hypothetical protein
LSAFDLSGLSTRCYIALLRINLNEDNGESDWRVGSFENVKVGYLTLHEGGVLHLNEGTPRERDAKTIAFAIYAMQFRREQDRMNRVHPTRLPFRLRAE